MPDRWVTGGEADNPFELLLKTMLWSPDALQKKILPLIIQPLVENAIRHGVMKNEDGGTVRLTIQLEGD